MDKILEAQDRLQLKVDSIEAAHIARAAEAAAQTLSESSRDGQNPVFKASPTQCIRLRTSLPSSGCGVYCGCSCHVKTRFRFQSINKILGSIFIGYVGLPFVTLKCDHHLCRQRACANTLISYVFPPWFLARGFTMTFRLFPFARPELIIRINPVVPGSSAIFTSAGAGDVEAIKRVLSAGLGSPFDAEISTGTTPLLVRYFCLDTQTLADVLCSTRSTRAKQGVLRSSFKQAQIHTKRTIMEGMLQFATDRLLNQLVTLEITATPLQSTGYSG